VAYVIGDTVLENLEPPVPLIVFYHKLFSFNFLGFLVLLAYMGAEAEFICNQWERKGLHTDIYGTV
jgi:hypothetical protein